MIWVKFAPKSNALIWMPVLMFLVRGLLYKVEKSMSRDTNLLVSRALL